MTMFFDSEIDRIFKKMSNSFFDITDVFEEFKGNSDSGPLFYGYTMTVGPDGKPVVRDVRCGRGGWEWAGSGRAGDVRS